MKDKKERLKELLALQNEKRKEAEEQRAYEIVVEEVNELFSNIRFEEEVAILSKEASKKITDDLFEEFPFCHSGIDWTRMFYKTIFSNFVDYESALAELVMKNHKEQHTYCYIIDLNAQHVIKTQLVNILHRVEEVRHWDKYIYAPQIQLVMEFPSNDIAVGWKK